MKIIANANNIIRMLQASFTDRDTFVRELIQNASRAGATQVTTHIPEPSTLIVEDNGCGIKDMSTLLDIGASGWDTNDMSPYGVGFLSAVFACGYFEVHSNGACLSAHTEQLLSGQSATITTSDVKVGTRVVLQGLKNKVSQMILETSTEGLSLNGGGDFSLIKNPTQIEIPDVGTLIYTGHRTLPRNMQSINCALFLQGFRINGSSNDNRISPHAANFALHLDQTKFFGRMPDRACLLGDNVPVALLNTWITKLIEVMPITNDKSYALVAAYAPDRIFNEILMRSAATLPDIFSSHYEISSYEVEENNVTTLAPSEARKLHTDWDENPSTSKDRLLLRGLIMLRDDGCLVYSSAYTPTPSWVAPVTKLSVRVIPPPNAETVGNYVLAKSVCVQLVDELNDTVVFEWEETEWSFKIGQVTYLIDATTVSDYMFMQDDEYTDPDTGEWDRVLIGKEVAQTNLKIALLRGAGLEVVVHSMLRHDRRLRDKRFEVAFDLSGAPTVKEIIDTPAVDAAPTED